MRVSVPGISTLALVVLVASGCGRPLVETPIERRSVVADLVHLSGGKPSDPRLDAEVSLPRRAVLRVGGQLSKAEEGEQGNAIFRVRVGERLVIEEALRSFGQYQRFNAEVPLDGSGAGEVSIRLEIDNPAPDVAKAAWELAVVDEVMPTPRQSDARGRNLLLVVADTWRADHSSVYGYERPTTPFLEELAESARVYDHAITTSSWTAPSVASLMTGLYPLEHRVINGERLHYQFETLAETLQADGITTYAASANPLIDRRAGYAQGFESFDEAFWEPAWLLNELFLDWLDDHRGVRWFGYLHYIDPHGPYSAPGEAGEAFVDPSYDGVFRQPNALNELFLTVNFGLPPAFEYDEEDLRFLKGAYDGEILYLDSQIRALFAALESRGLLEDTIVVITSDHGEEFVEHGLFKHGHQLYDESIRVPLIVYAPGRVPPGRVATQVENRGIVRAALQLMGVADFEPRPNDLLRIEDGDRYPAFSHTRHQPAPTLPRRPVVASVRDDLWKLIFWQENGRYALYDLGADPAEQVDVIEDEKETAREYRRLLRTWLQTSGPPSAEDAADAPLDPALVEDLRALGYIR